MLEDFVASAAMIDEDAVINGNINFTRHLDVEDLVINHLLNGHDVNDIVRNGLRKDNKDGLEWPRLTVHGNLTFKVLCASLDIYYVILKLSSHCIGLDRYKYYQRL